MDIPGVTIRGTNLPDLLPSDSAIQFPTRGAFLDALVVSMMYSPTGSPNMKLHSQLGVSASYLMIYTLNEDTHVNNTGGLTDRSLKPVSEVSEENRPFLGSRLGLGKPVSFEKLRQRREEIIQSKALVNRQISSISRTSSNISVASAGHHYPWLQSFNVHHNHPITA
ncbi:hypothetical protein FRB94_009818 [Tulasnella sp. JGI-2019a]|nr:hypothetical protein FRB94_009818 [Tulasnella sp. JGI-2019a]KAG9025807.1 hypothetical protein FRB95_009759 [Tulasnella sp. JGI-2019a]